MIGKEFNESLVDNKMKELTFSSCKFKYGFEWKIQFKFLEILHLENTNKLDFKSLYESLKGNQCLQSLTLDTFRYFNGDYLFNILSETNCSNLFIDGIDKIFNYYNDFQGSFNLKKIEIYKEMNSKNINKFIEKNQNLETLKLKTWSFIHQMFQIYAKY